MQFAKNNCDKCACKGVCSIKDDVSLFRTDLMNLKYYGEQKYVEKFPQLTVQIECSNYIDKTKLGDVG